MKKVVVLATALAVLTAPLAHAAENAPGAGVTVAAAHEYTAKTPKLKRAEIDALLAKPEQILIIDVRRPDEQTAMGDFRFFSRSEQRS